MAGRHATTRAATSATRRQRRLYRRAGFTADGVTRRGGDGIGLDEARLVATR